MLTLRDKNQDFSEWYLLSQFQKKFTNVDLGLGLGILVPLTNGSFWALAKMRIIESIRMQSNNVTQYKEGYDLSSIFLMST